MKYIILLVLVLSVSAHAGWLTATGTVKKIATYAHAETILVDISEGDIGSGTCSNKKTFAISSQISAEARARMYSMLLSAQATGREVLISYLDQGGCESWFSTQGVYRQITVLR